MHFSNACTHERCVGYWAIRIDEGRFGEVPLSGLKAFIAFDSPQHMIEGNWTEVVIIDEAASSEQRAALETILTGRAGGSWGLLAKFVSRWLETRFLPIEFSDEDATKRARIPGLLETSDHPDQGPRPLAAGHVREHLQPDPRLLAGDRARADEL